MTIILFIAINFGAIYRTTKSSYRDSPTCDEACFVSFSDNFFQFRAPTFVNSSSVHLAIFKEKWRQQKQKTESSETEYSIHGNLL